MVVIAGHWEIGYNSPIIEHYQWALPLRDFGVSEWAMCPVSGIANTEESRLPFREFKDYNEMLGAYSDLPRVFLEPRGPHNKETVWLHDFEHPTDALYVFGSAHFNPTLQHVREGDTVVTIKTMEDKGVLWSSQALVITLYDRMVKSWR